MDLLIYGFMDIWIYGYMDIWIIKFYASNLYKINNTKTLLITPVVVASNDCEEDAIVPIQKNIVHKSP